MSAATAVPVNPRLSMAEMTRDFQRLDLKAVVLGSDVDAAVTDLCAGLGLPILPVEHLFDRYDTPRYVPLGDRPSLDDVMMIAHTSGTTALPKRVPITHRMQLAAARARNRMRGLGADDACLLVAPSFTVMFMTNVVTMLVAGGALICSPYLDPLLALRANAELMPTWIHATPAFLSGMVQFASQRPDLFQNPRLRLVNWGGAGADPGLVCRLESAFGAPANTNYGMSEASAIAMSRTPGPRSPGSVGLAAAGEVRIVDSMGRPTPPGEAGEIVTRGPNVFSGYLDDPEANASAFYPGSWFRTGDIGYLDADSYLFLTGRLKEQINRGGEMISPVDVEQALVSHPAVYDAAVFGIADSVLGEDVAAAVVLRPGLSASPRELRSWMLDRLTPHKVPRRIWFVSEIPRTASGKVRRGMLADRYREQYDG
jgi:acyl-CoA synthetase (AMP-forming)/AMP-acid ligase II